MEKIKPEVVGYVQIEFDGREYDRRKLLTKGAMIMTARIDFGLTLKKPKFRPVYKTD